MELIPVKPGSLSLLELLNIANEAYPDAFLGAYFDSKTGERIEGRGDSLARFVVAELSETLDPELVRTKQLDDGNLCPERRQSTPGNPQACFFTALASATVTLDNSAFTNAPDWFRTLPCSGIGPC